MEGVWQREVLQLLCYSAHCTVNATDGCALVSSLVHFDLMLFKSRGKSKIRYLHCSGTHLKLLYSKFNLYLYNSNVFLFSHYLPLYFLTTMFLPLKLQL